MAKPKRKSPDRRTSRKRQPSRTMLALQTIFGTIANYPRLISGVVIFSVVFSFVAANALWYQPRHHPSPLMVTRADGDTAIGAQKRPVLAGLDEPGVTTFRIEREDPEAEKKAAEARARKPDPLVRDIQDELAARGLYTGPVDGVGGERTTSAILFFQETEGLQQTGTPSKALLAKLRSNSTAVGVIDEPQAGETTGSNPPQDEVADLIRKTDDVADIIKAAEKSGTVPVPATQRASASNSDQSLPVDGVMQIQKALASLAYENIKVDGIVGNSTRAAIRSFEKNYRLPVTGEPSERVLRKLKAIGAI